MLSDTIQKALNDQLNLEIYSAYIYYGMGGYLADLGMDGGVAWMRAQAVEELTHADRIFRYIAERGGRVQLEAIEGPPNVWESPLAAFEAALAHEQKVSASINDIVALAREERDYPTDNFLQWFVAEQVEEEASVGEVVAKLELMGGAPGGLFMIDRDLAQRQVSGPSGEDG